MTPRAQVPQAVADIADMTGHAAELLRPWKLATLASGVALLLAGSRYMPAPDWGIADSLLLAGYTYCTAPLVFRWLLVERRWRMLPVALLLTWWGAFGLYAAYWGIVDPHALAMMGEAAVPANLALYLAAGLLWAPRMTATGLLKAGHRLCRFQIRL